MSGPHEVADPAGSHGLVASTIPFSCVDGPGNRFVLFLQGCSFDCVACHNPWTIPARSARARAMSVPEVLDEIRGPAPFLSGVTVSGGEATCQWPFVRALFAALRADPLLGRLSRFVDTNGNADAAVWDSLAPDLHGAMVDLKAFDPAVHRALTGSGNERVLASIEHLAALDRLHEVRLLLVPGMNDDEAQLRATADWLGRIDRAVRVVLMGFRHHGVRQVGRAFPEATAETLAAAAGVLRDAGLTNVVLVPVPTA